jgi:hypothetical protein
MDVQNVINRSASHQLHKVIRELLDPYHPERHYMRGPGPRWRQKHARDQVAAPRCPEQPCSCSH